MIVIIAIKSEYYAFQTQQLRKLLKLLILTNKTILFRMVFMILFFNRLCNYFLPNNVNIFFLYTSTPGWLNGSTANNLALTAQAFKKK